MPTRKSQFLMEFTVFLDGEPYLWLLMGIAPRKSMAVGLLSHFATDRLGCAFKGNHTRACALIKVTFVMTLKWWDLGTKTRSWYWVGANCWRWWQWVGWMKAWERKKKKRNVDLSIVRSAPSHTARSPGSSSGRDQVFRDVSAYLSSDGLTARRFCGHHENHSKPHTREANSVTWHHLSSEHPELHWNTLLLATIQGSALPISRTMFKWRFETWKHSGFEKNGDLGDCNFF
jgi:hypothetical protein